MKHIGVAVVVDSGKVLIGVRPAGTVLAGMHEFPGGKCEQNESPAACAIRECLEETGLRVEVVESLLHCVQRYDHGEVDLSFFLCQLLESNPPQPVFQWVPINELQALNFPAANREVVDKLLSRCCEQNRSKQSMS